MRVLLKARMDVAAANEAVKSGAIAPALQDVMKKLQPEAAYFGPDGGKRTAFIFFDLKDPSQIPAVSEPFFQVTHASVEIIPVMNADDLQ
jgi:hypothetical protein